MNVASNRWEHAAALAATRERAADFIRWRQTLERYTTAIGVRSQLAHVGDERWQEWFDAGQDPEGAVIAEMAEVAD